MLFAYNRKKVRTLLLTNDVYRFLVRHVPEGVTVSFEWDDGTPIQVVRQPQIVNIGMPSNGRRAVLMTITGLPRDLPVPEPMGFDMRKVPPEAMLNKEFVSVDHNYQP